MTLRSTARAGALVAVLLSCACDGGNPGRLGDPCRDDGECESGFCFQSTCMDPGSDQDLDGLTNARERAIGSDPTRVDTDGDGKDDFAEFGPGPEPLDSDGDGRPDLLESAILDADGDCLPDELDPDDRVSALDPLVPKICRDAGVCGTYQAAIVAVCSADGAPRCEYGAVPGWEADEVTCDHLDNDCDGETDEGFADPDGDGDPCTVGPVCGDGVPAEGVEACDEGVHNTDTPCDPGPYPGSCTHCTLGCRLVTVAAPVVCGDGVRAEGVEECDAGPTNTDTPCDPGPYPGSCTYCTLGCQLVTVAAPVICGDGVPVEGAEECDEGAANTDTPCDPGPYPGSCTFCTRGCQLVTVAAPVVCGDGVPVEGAEECDAGPDNTDTPCDPGPYPGSCTYCTRGCQLVTVAAPNPCGNGTYDEGELCDDGPDNTETPCDPTGRESCIWCDPSCQPHVAWEPTTVTGVVTDVTRFDLAPVAGAVVAAAGVPPVTTGPDGAFTFEVEGAYELVVSVSVPPDAAGSVAYTRYVEALAVRPGETVRLQPRLAEACLGATYDESAEWVPWEVASYATSCPWFERFCELPLPVPPSLPRATSLPVFTGAGYDGRFRVQVADLGNDPALARAIPPGRGEPLAGGESRLRFLAVAEVRAFGGPALDVPLELAPEYVALMRPELTLERNGWTDQELGAYWLDEARGRWVQRGMEFQNEGDYPSVHVDRVGWWAIAEPIAPPACVSGTVTRGGAPAAGVELQLRDPEGGRVELARTGPDGRFCLEGSRFSQRPTPLHATYRDDDGARHALAVDAFPAEGTCGAAPSGCADVGELALTLDEGQCVQGTAGDLPEPRLWLYQDDGSWWRHYRGAVALTWDAAAQTNRFCARVPRAAAGYSASGERGACDPQDPTAATQLVFDVPDDDLTPGGEDCEDPAAECALLSPEGACVPPAVW
jgi:hypothetical protein